MKTADAVAALGQENTLYEKYTDAVERKRQGYHDACMLPTVYDEDPQELLASLKTHADAKNWSVVLEISETLTDTAPEEILGWVHRSEALHQLNRTKESREHLLRAVRGFPEASEICYNLARYECKLGDLEQAKVWLKKALSLKHSEAWRKEALTDPALQALREQASCWKPDLNI